MLAQLKRAGRAADIQAWRCSSGRRAGRQACERQQQRKAGRQAGERQAAGAGPGAPLLRTSQHVGHKEQEFAGVLGHVDSLEEAAQLRVAQHPAVEAVHHRLVGDGKEGGRGLVCILSRAAHMKAARERVQRAHVPHAHACKAGRVPEASKRQVAAATSHGPSPRKAAAAQPPDNSSCAAAAERAGS